MVNKFHQLQLECMIDSFILMNVLHCICPFTITLENNSTNHYHYNIDRMYAIFTYLLSTALCFKANSCEILQQIPRITRIKYCLGDIFNAREKSLQTVSCLLLLQQYAAKLQHLNV